jgi:hypothetical protein
VPWIITFHRQNSFEDVAYMISVGKGPVWVCFGTFFLNFLQPQALVRYQLHFQESLQGLLFIRVRKQF